MANGVNRRTFLGLLGGAFAAVGIPIKILDPFRSGRKLFDIPGGRTILTLTISTPGALPGNPSISALAVAANGSERVLLKSWLANNGISGTSIRWDFPCGIRFENGSRFLIYTHSPTKPPAMSYEIDFTDDETSYLGRERFTDGKITRMTWRS